MFTPSRRAGDSDAARIAADAAAQDANSAVEELRLFKLRFDRLALVNQALWEILSEKLGLTESDLRARMAEIDARDDRIDGKLTLSAIDCPVCHRKTPARQTKCMYCGLEIPGPVFGQLG